MPALMVPGHQISIKVGTTEPNTTVNGVESLKWTIDNEFEDIDVLEGGGWTMTAIPRGRVTGSIDCVLLTNSAGNDLDPGQAILFGAASAAGLVALQIVVGNPTAPLATVTFQAAMRLSQDATAKQTGRITYEFQSNGSVVIQS